jgi:PAS domain S-box-containing protein
MPSMPIPLRLLLVEDSEDDARLVLRVLRRGGYEPMVERVDTAPAMRAALARGRWDLVLSDHTMPRLSSEKALAIAREAGTDVPFIIVSGSIGEEAAVAAMKAGAADYVTKDNLARLVPAIERELREADIRRERLRALELGTRLSRILDSSPDEILVFDARRLQLVQVNAGARRKLGYSTAELMALSPLDLLPELTAAHLESLLAPLRAGTQEQLVLETVHRRKDGSTYPVEVRLQYSHDEAPPVFVAIAQDISARKRDEAALRQAQQRYFDLVQSIDGIVWEADACTFAFTFVSEQAERLLGYPTQRWYDEPSFWADHLHPDDRERALALRARAAVQGEAHEFEYRLLAPDGRAVWLRDVVTVVREEGQPPRLRGMMIDITRRKLDEQERERTNSVLRATLESTADGILVVDLAGQFRTFNRKFVEMWQLPEALVETLDDAHWRTFVLDQLVDPHAWLAQVERLYREPEAESFDVVEFKDGRVLERYSQPQRINGVSVGRVWSFRDVTARRHIEQERDALLADLQRSLEELSRTQAELVTRERLAALGELAAVVAHEVRNPLGVMFNSLASLRKLIPRDGDAVTLFGILEEEARRINEMVRDLLVFARPIQPVARPARLIDVVDEAFMAAARAQPSAAHVTVERTFDPRLPAVPLDQQYMHIALVNVIANSLQAMPHGGRLTLAVEQIERESAPWAQVFITDSGPGIASEHLGRIFEPFFTTKASGTGLGLAIVKRIVEGHHGDVAVRSEPERGTTFVIRLPLTSAESPASVSAP